VKTLPRAMPSLVLAHHHPGRLRLRSDSFCSGPCRPKAAETFECVRLALSRQTGVRVVHWSEASGSVLVTYEPGTCDPNALIDIVAETAGLGPPTSDELRDRHGRLADAAIGVVRSLDAWTREITDGRADLRVLVPIAMTGMAALSFVAKKDRMPHWANLAFWAYSIFQSMHVAEIATRPERPERQRPS
jgi:hypothetical protein